MVRHVTTQTRAWTAFLAILVAGGAIVWHILACTESPMAFSPDGKQLAFVTMEPYDDSDIQIAGKHAFRLMVLGEDRQVRVLETTTKQMLSAPAYSPDGKQLCYVRVRQATEATWEQINNLSKKHDEALGPPGYDVWAEPTTTQSETAASQPTTTSSPTKPQSEMMDLALPSGAVISETMVNLMYFPAIPAELVVRETKSDRIISTTALELAILGKDGRAGYFIAYATLRPQYSPDGKWIYLPAGNTVFSFNPATGEKRLVSVAAPIAALSPEGDTLAILAEKAIAFAQTDGSSALYKRWDKRISYSGLTWLDRRTLAILEPANEEKDSARLHLVEQDGSIKRSITLDLKEARPRKGEDHGELAIAPNGKNIVVAYQHDTFFLDGEGKLLWHWHHDQDMMVQPTFSPDSSRIACKYMTKDQVLGYRRVAAIVFFSPEGKQLSSVPIPPIDPATTQLSPMD